MTRAGKLRWPAVIQTPTDSQDAVGGPTQTWGTHLSPWGEFVSMSSRWAERFAAQREVASCHGIFKIRYQPSHGITPKMRVYVDGRYLDIVYVTDPDGRKTDLFLFYREVQA